MNQSQKGNAMEGGFLMHSSSKMNKSTKFKVEIYPENISVIFEVGLGLFENN